jgi:hypothetical protein
MKYEIVSQSLSPYEFIPQSVVMKHLRLFDYTEADVIEYYMKSAIAMVESRLNMIFRSASTPTIVKVATGNSSLKLRGLFMFTEIAGAYYYANDDTYKELAGDRFIFTKVIHPYEISVVDTPEDLKQNGDYTYSFQFSGGVYASQAPTQVLEAILLLVGHYYNQRESEHIGGVTTMVKEGVDRLLASAKKY